MNIGAGSVFADVGSGTEIFAEQLLECGYKVFAVEPNGDMRKKAEEKLSRNENFGIVFLAGQLINDCETKSGFLGFFDVFCIVISLFVSQAVCDDLLRERMGHQNFVVIVYKSKPVRLSVGGKREFVFCQLFPAAVAFHVRNPDVCVDCHVRFELLCRNFNGTRSKSTDLLQIHIRWAFEFLNVSGDGKHGIVVPFGNQRILVMRTQHGLDHFFC